MAVSTVDPILEAENLSKRYDGFSLDQVSFSLPSGYVLGLMGPNGAGKSTIVKLILGAIQPSGGKVRLFGGAGSTPQHVLQSRIGFVHEVPPMYNHLSVIEYGDLIGMFYTGWNREQYGETVRRFELPMKKRTGTLSRGMRMKLALATAMSHDADLLILDEPTSGLDPVFRREFLDELRGYIEDGTRSVMFSTHITSDLEHIADYIVYLRGGRIRLNESAEVLRERWKLVRGAPEVLTDELREVLNAVTKDEYSFSAITSKPEDAIKLSNGKIELEPVKFEDIVVFLEEEHE